MVNQAKRHHLIGGHLVVEKVVSMTGFASAQGGGFGYVWSWDLKAVNGRGLDLRTRLPDWIPGLDQSARKALRSAIERGSVTLGLRLIAQDETAEIAMPSGERIDAAIHLVRAIEDRARALDFMTAPCGASDILNIKGVMDGGGEIKDHAALATALLDELAALIEAFNATRLEEGEKLKTIILEQLEQIGRLIGQAETLVPKRAEAQKNALESALERIGSVADGVDEARIAQELALIAVKSDVTEELDRLRAHVDGASALLAKGGTIGRKLDFLCQEFNREANTLCSKSGDTDLTRVGLDLKALIDQMREQVQNVE